MIPDPRQIGDGDGDHDDPRSQIRIVGPGACRAAASALNGSGQQPENEPVPSFIQWLSSPSVTARSDPGNLKEGPKKTIVLTTTSSNCKSPIKLTKFKLNLHEVRRPAMSDDSDAADCGGSSDSDAESASIQVPQVEPGSGSQLERNRAFWRMPVITILASDWSPSCRIPSPTWSRMRTITVTGNAGIDIDRRHGLSEVTR